MICKRMMAMFPLKLYKISRIFFCVFVVLQAFLLSRYMVENEDDDVYYALTAVVLVFFVFGVPKFGELKNHLGRVWFSYSLPLVGMIAAIYGRIVIEENKLKEGEMLSCLYNGTSNSTVNSHDESHSFFDAKLLKITLCLTPGAMLLLLTSVTGETEILTQLYFTTVMDLFDGVEMLEVLHEDVCNRLPMGWEVAVLAASCLFFFFSFLEVHQVKPTEDDEWKFRKMTTIVSTGFQLVLNVAFLVIRAVLWYKYDYGSAIFLAKNIISIIIVLVSVLECCGVITRKAA